VIHKPRYYITYFDDRWWAAHKSMLVMQQGTSLEMALKRAREAKKRYEKVEEILDD